MNPVYTPKEIARQLKMSNATWAVTSHDLVPVIKAAVDILEAEGIFKKGAWRDRIIVTGGLLSFLADITNSILKSVIPNQQW